jgi:hypothetical protein
MSPAVGHAIAERWRRDADSDEKPRAAPRVGATRRLDESQGEGTVTIFLR